MMGMAAQGENGSAMRKAGAGARRLAARLWQDRRGVAAVEFAFIAPIMFCMYFLTMEISQAIETSKKVSRIGSMVGDLVTQQSTISKAETDALLTIGEALLQPYNRSRPTITVTAIQITTDATPKVLVSWSRKLSNGVYSAGAAKGTTTTVPASLKVAGTFLLRVESQLTYTPVVAWSDSQEKTLGITAAFSSINMGDTYYLRPRMSDSVPCGDC